VWRYPDGDLGVGCPLPGLIVGFGVTLVLTQEGRVQAVDQYTGAPLWREDLRRLLVGAVFLPERQVLVCTADGDALILNAVRGGVLQRHSLGMTVASTPAVVGDRLYAMACDGEGWVVAAFSVDGGSCRALWRTVLAGPEDTRRATAPVAATGTHVVVADHRGAVCCLSADTGQIAHTEEVSPPAPVFAAPVIALDSIYIAARNGRCTRLDLATGKPTGWAMTEVEAPVYNSLAIVGGRAYVTTHSGFVCEFDAQTGGESAATEVPRCPGWNSGLTSGVATRDYVFFGASTGHVYAFHRASSWPIMMAKMDSAVVGPPAISDGSVFVATQQGFVYALCEWRLGNGGS